MSSIRFTPEKMGRVPIPMANVQLMVLMVKHGPMMAIPLAMLVRTSSC